MADLRLRIVDGPDVGREFEIGGALVIGRDPSAGLVVRDPEVSRRHASIMVAGDGAEVSDLDSTNGTFVNGERIEGSRTVSGGDRLRVGVTVFEVELAAQPTQFAAVVPDDPGATSIASVSTAEELERRVRAEEEMRHAQPEGADDDGDDLPTVVPDEEDEPAAEAPPSPDQGAQASAEPVADVGRPTEAGPGAQGVPSPAPVADVGQPTEAGPGAAGVPAPSPPPAPQPPPAPPAAPQPPPAPPAAPQPPPAPPHAPAPGPFAAGTRAQPKKPGLLRRLFRRGGGG